MTSRRNASALLTVALLLLFAAEGCAPVVDPSSPVPYKAGAQSPVQIYNNLAPSVAFIDTPAGTGSGLLTQLGDERYVVTNAHVVWPFSHVRVVFPNGEEHLSVPLVADDQLVDLAILGPVESSLPPVDMAVPSDLQPGETVYLVGYPGEGELFPAPAITEGILSRTRIWDALDSLRYFQTDAAGAGGQSGGVLVSSQGDVVGISGMLFSDVFVLAASTQDLASRQNDMLVMAAPETIDSDMPPTSGRRLRQELDSLWDTNGYFVSAAPGDLLEVTAASGSDLALSLFDAGPEELTYADNTLDGNEVISTTVAIDAPTILVVEQFVPGPATYQLRSSHALQPIPDDDDGTRLTYGDTIVGYLDYPADIDTFVMALTPGDVITVTAEATAIDPLLSIGPLGETADNYLEDDDSGRGMLGSSAIVVYQAQRTGDHLIVVRSFSTTDVGGYLVTVDSPP